MKDIFIDSDNEKKFEIGNKRFKSKIKEMKDDKKLDKLKDKLKLAIIDIDNMFQLEKIRRK